MAGRRQRRRRLSGANLDAALATPARGRQQIDDEETAAAAAAQSNLGTNNDEAERERTRRRSMARRRSIARTPLRSASRGRSANSPFVRRGSFVQDMLNAGQLSDLYSQCVNLSQHGKINQNNAWNLQLTAHMSKILDLDDANANAEAVAAQNKKETNFQRASHAIDAASKIYSSRVDSVHNATYKVLGCMHQQGGNDDGTIDPSLLADQKAQRRSRNRNVGKNTIATNKESLKVSLTELSVCVDPMFHKTASAFDEGGAKGLLMNQLFVQNACEIVFDSTTVIRAADNVSESDISPIDEAIEKEWMTHLSYHTFGSKTEPKQSSVDDMTELSQSPPIDLDNIDIDIDWVNKTDVCPLVQHFDKGIAEIEKVLPPDRHRFDSDANDNSDRPMMEALDNEFGDDDDDVMLGMPGYTDDGQPLLNEEVMNEIPCTQLFHDDGVDIWAGGPVGADLGRLDYGDDGGEIGFTGIPLSGHATVLSGFQNMQIDQSTQIAASNAMANGEIAPVQIIPRNTEMQFEVNRNDALATMQAQKPQMSRAMNLSVMNDFIAKLETSDMEDLTTFFDPKKHGNWAGPDQWYHRRLQLAFAKTNKKKASSADNSPTNAASEVLQLRNGDEEYIPQPSKLKKDSPKRNSKSHRIDFLAIATGDFIDDKCFDEPLRSNNTLTDFRLKKNEEKTHRLPKDLQIKPSLFIKMFSKPSYSVWNHWLKVYQMRAKAAATLNSTDEEMLSRRVAGGDTDPNHIQPRMAAMASAMAADDEDGSDKGFYDYNNAMDSQNFVPPIAGMGFNNGDNDDGGIDMWGGAGVDDAAGDFNMIEAPRAVEKIKVEYAVKAKKVDVRNLKNSMWKGLSQLQLSAVERTNKENRDANNADEVTADTDTVMAEDSVGSDEKPQSTFQTAIDTLNDSIDSRQLNNISIPFCFICLLHLANEKNLDFKTVDDTTDEATMGGDFEVVNASDVLSAAEKPRPMMVLGSAK